jgi:hypothetical protein
MNSFFKKLLHIPLLQMLILGITLGFAFLILPLKQTSLFQVSAAGCEAIIVPYGQPLAGTYNTVEECRTRLGIVSLNSCTATCTSVNACSCPSGCAKNGLVSEGEKCGVLTAGSINFCPAGSSQTSPISAVEGVQTGSNCECVKPTGGTYAFVSTATGSTLPTQCRSSTDTGAACNFAGQPYDLGQQFCFNSTTAATCGSGGNYSTSPCASGDICTNGSCQHSTCTTPGDKVCISGEEYTCQGANYNKTASSCTTTASWICPSGSHTSGTSATAAMCACTKPGTTSPLITFPNTQSLPSTCKSGSGGGTTCSCGDGTTQPKGTSTCAQVCTGHEQAGGGGGSCSNGCCTATGTNQVAVHRCDGPLVNGACSDPHFTTQSGTVCLDSNFCGSMQLDIVDANGNETGTGGVSTNGNSCGGTTGPVCLNLSISKSNPKVGDSVTFTCGNVAGATKYEFRVKLPDGTIQALSTTASTTANPKPRTSTALTISSQGAYAAQCRICTGANGSTCQQYESF